MSSNDTGGTTGLGGGDIAFTGQPGDCTVTVPAGTAVLRGDHVQDSGNLVAWVCDGAEVVANSGDSVLFVESGAQVVFNSGNSTSWVKAGAQVLTNAGTVALTHEPGATIDEQAGQTTRYACDTVVFDTTALDEGCD